MVGSKASVRAKLKSCRREGGTALCHPLAVTVRQAVNKPAGVDFPRGLFNGSIGDALFPQADVALDIAGEDKHILLNLPDGAADLIPG